MEAEVPLVAEVAPIPFQNVSLPAVTPVLRVVVPEVETTRALPPDEGVLKARARVPFE